jgi:hypothetical protein
MISPTLFSAGPVPRPKSGIQLHFWGYMVKGICSQDKDIFRGIAEFSVFLLLAFSSFRPLKKVWVHSPTPA